jgi:integrase
VAYVNRLPSGHWRVQWRDGRRHSATYSTERLARHHGEEAEARARAGAHTHAGKITVADYSRQWMASRTVEPRTAQNDRYRLDRHVLPTFGARRLADVTNLDVQQWVSELTRALSGETVRACHRLLASMFATAVHGGQLSSNPAANVTLPARGAGSEVYLTRDEVEAIAWAIETPTLSIHNGRSADSLELAETYGVVVRVLAYTGLRWGELAGLHRRRLRPRSLTVVEVTDGLGGIKAYPKGGRRRDVPLAAPVADRIEEYLRSHPAKSGDLVFRRPSGGPLDNHAFNGPWHRARRLAGVQYARPHDLRHTCASWLVQAGVPLLEVSRMLGHTSPAVTMRYAHLEPGRWDRIRDALD